jgi:hypothetical protein
MTVPLWLFVALFAEADVRSSVGSGHTRLIARLGEREKTRAPFGQQGVWVSLHQHGRGNHEQGNN